MQRRYAKRCKTMHRRTSSGEEMQPDNLSMPIARARDADALQAARTQRRRAAAAAHGIFGTHKRTTCGARMQRDMPPPRLLRNTRGAARGRSRPCRAVLVGPDGRVDATHHAAEKNTNRANRSRKNAQARLPLLVRVRERGPPRQARGPGVRCRPRRLPQAGPLLEGRLRDRH